MAFFFFKQALNKVIFSCAHSKTSEAVLLHKRKIFEMISTFGQS